MRNTNVVETRDTGSTAGSATVPRTEKLVLDALKAQQRDGKPTHGPAIARATGGKVSVSAIYVLLDRLCKRGLVSRRDEVVQPDGFDVGFKRVSYSVME